MINWLYTHVLPLKNTINGSLFDEPPLVCLELWLGPRSIWSRWADPNGRGWCSERGLDCPTSSVRVKSCHLPRAQPEVQLNQRLWVTAVFKTFKHRGSSPVSVKEKDGKNPACSRRLQWRSTHKWGPINASRPLPDFPRRPTEIPMAYVKQTTRNLAVFFWVNIPGWQRLGTGYWT